MAQGMTGEEPEFLEALRLIREFFPESKSRLTDDVGLCWDSFLGAMLTTGATNDCSCDPFWDPAWLKGKCKDHHGIQLVEKGGVDGTEIEVYSRILDHTTITPIGRAVVVPDAIGLGGSSMERKLPFVCSIEKIPDHIMKFEDYTDPLTGNSARYLFGSIDDTIIVFESGEAILLNHDDRLFWAKSKMRQVKG